MGEPYHTVSRLVDLAGRLRQVVAGNEKRAADRIEKEMPNAMPEVQWIVNNTLGAIGIHDTKLRKRAIAIRAAPRRPKCPNRRIC
jgi:hypothetical protein